MNSTFPLRPRKSHYRWTIVLTLSAVAFVLYVDRINIMIAAPHLDAEFNLSDQKLGHILSAFLFGYALGLVPGGWFADRLGPRKVLTFAAVSWAGLTVMIGLVPKNGFGLQQNPGIALVGLRFLLGLCEACAFPTFARALANWIRPSERAMASGLIHVGSNLGGVFTPVLIAFIIRRFGWRQSFLCSGAITLAVALWWWSKATDTPSDHPQVSEQELGLIASEKEEMQVERPDFAWYQRLFRSRNAYMLCLSEVFYGLSGFVFLTWFYVYFVKIRGAGDLYSAVLTSLTYLAGAAGALVGGILCDFSVTKWGSPWGRRIVPLLAISASGVCCIIAPVIHNNTASAVIFSTAAGLQFVAAPAFWATVIDITRRGPGILGGFMNGSGNLGAAIGTVTFPRLISIAGWGTALQLAGLAGLVSGLIWWLIDSSRQIDTLPASISVSS